MLPAESRNLAPGPERNAALAPETWLWGIHPDLSPEAPIGDVYFWGSLMAGCLIASVPIAVVYNFFVDRFIAGFTVGVIK